MPRKVYEVIWTQKDGKPGPSFSMRGEEDDVREEALSQVTCFGGQLLELKPETQQKNKEEYYA